MKLETGNSMWNDFKTYNYFTNEDNVYNHTYMIKTKRVS